MRLVANTKSAKKRILIIRKRTMRNKAIRSAVKTAIKKFEMALKVKPAEEARELLRQAVRALDKAVTKGVIHKNTASRKKSRLTRKFNSVYKAS
ncbi:ribosomal protein S20 [Carboxydothermus hydrogenoformans Z-2901]|uniref:Small ribosomal subunit protein bS20 n=1 Tax=Carboxydothermus hydrogenoformans (strain ATCC BAA-161 / DSM 6008 / Z-2901) TaxID=246194 RepID=RS20_CARHZ|nr:RecName: Full=Small ribosomal subunit protein bS20; AltName: Full=30S ribosomal protein S20 [Carboxydothermus hydrogenoformans Z-2901]ABB15411.1 ribosomal protein S20 [Carboxydothermus hydrogenoformans Z-2901]